MPSDRRVVVTGASGLVGAGVVEELRRAGYEVVGVARRGRPDGWDDVDWVRAVNMEACERLFHYFGEHGVGKVIFTSSLGVLARPLRSPITERDPVGPV